MTQTIARGKFPFTGLILKWASSIAGVLFLVWMADGEHTWSVDKPGYLLTMLLLLLVFQCLGKRLRSISYDEQTGSLTAEYTILGFVRIKKQLMASKASVEVNKAWLPVLFEPKSIYFVRDKKREVFSIKQRRDGLTDEEMERILDKCLTIKIPIRNI